MSVNDNVFRIILVVGFLILIPITAYHRVKTKKEEENLLVRFGDEYLKYMERTGRFVKTWLHEQSNNNTALKILSSPIRW